VVSILSILRPLICWPKNLPFEWEVLGNQSGKFLRIGEGRRLATLR